MDGTGRRTPDSGTVTETETETVTESETVTGFAWSRWSSRTPDPGPRIPERWPRPSRRPWPWPNGLRRGQAPCASEAGLRSRKRRNGSRPRRDAASPFGW